MMLNPIPTIRQIYQLDNHPENNGISRQTVEQHEAELSIQLPASLYHYLLELGNVEAINSTYNAFVELPFERLGEYLVIGNTCDADGVWGIATDELTQHNPMVQMSRNFDAIEQSEVHWFNALPLAEFLLAQAIMNGINGGLSYHAQIYDFLGNTIPHDLGEKLENLASEIKALERPHERYFEVENFGVVMMLSLDDNKPTAFLMGSQRQKLFEKWINQLSL